MRILGDLFRRIARKIDEDLLSHDENTASPAITFNIKGAVSLEELYEVQGRQVTSRVVQEHVLRTRIGRMNAVRVQTRVPFVDRRVVLNTRIGASPSGF